MHPENEPPCGSWVEITDADLRGPFGIALEETEHPARRDHPGVKVGLCALEAGHRSRCEMFVDGPSGPDWLLYWLTWERPDPMGGPGGTYTWIQTHAFCDTPHPDLDEYVCARFIDHLDGHGMWNFLA